MADPDGDAVTSHNPPTIASVFGGAPAVDRDRKLRIPTDRYRAAQQGLRAAEKAEAALSDDEVECIAFDLEHMVYHPHSTGPMRRLLATLEKLLAEREEIAFVTGAHPAADLVTEIKRGVAMGEEDEKKLKRKRRSRDRVPGFVND